MRRGTIMRRRGAIMLRRGAMLAAVAVLAVTVAACGPLEAMLGGDEAVAADEDAGAEGATEEAEASAESAADETSPEAPEVEEVPAADEPGEPAEDGPEADDGMGQVVFGDETFAFDNVACSDSTGQSAYTETIVPTILMRAWLDDEDGMDLRIHVHPTEPERWTVSFDTGRGDTATFERFRMPYDYPDVDAVIEPSLDLVPGESASGAIHLLPDGSRGAQLHPDGALFLFEMSC